MDYLFIIYILFLHWLTDFVFQRNGEKKHEGWKILLTHTLWYSSLMGWGYYGYTGNLLLASQFAGITFIFHTITDYFTSRWNYKQLVAKRYKLWIDSIGFDQFLHQLQLIATIWIISR